MLPQLADAKRAADEHANTLEEVENARRKLSRDQEDLHSQIDDLKNQIQKLEKSKKRLQGMHVASGKLTCATNFMNCCPHDLTNYC